MLQLRLTIIAFLWAVPLKAEMPNVVTDIPPVHSLVSQIMQGTGNEPQLLLIAQADPHNLALRPSQAEMLQNANLIVWVGAALSPWMPNALDTLAPASTRLELLQVLDTNMLFISDMKDKHNHTSDHDTDDGFAIDPHSWLDPRNATIWRTAIAEQLAKIDPSNAQIYLTNAQSRNMVPNWDFSSLPPVLVEHDGLAYFANHTGLRVAQTINTAHGLAPSISDIRALQKTVEQNSIKCVLSNPSSDGQLLKTIFGSLRFKATPVLIMGDGQDLGPNYYDRTLTDLAAAVENCATN